MLGHNPKLLINGALTGVVQLVYDMMDEWERQDFDRSMQPYLESIEAIGAGMSQIDTKGMARGTLFIYTGQK